MKWKRPALESCQFSRWIETETEKAYICNKEPLERAECFLSNAIFSLLLFLLKRTAQNLLPQMPFSVYD